VSLGLFEGEFAEVSYKDLKMRQMCIKILVSFTFCGALKEFFSIQRSF
jgi:hypothetical protein